MFPFLFFFLAVLGFYCRLRAFSSCSEWGLLSSCAIQASHCDGFSCCGAQSLGRKPSIVVACWLSGTTAWGIFLDQGSNPCFLHWQVDSLPLSHLGSPGMFLNDLITNFIATSLGNLEFSGMKLNHYLNHLGTLDSRDQGRGYCQQSFENVIKPGFPKGLISKDR